MIYILNVNDAVAHYANLAGELCNTDDIKTKRIAGDLPEGYHLCEHCKARRSAVRAEELGLPTDDELVEGTDPDGPDPVGVFNSLKEESDGRE